jgi:hypothetical protein
MELNIELLHYELKQAGLPIVGVSSDGRIDYSRALTAAEQATADQVVADHDPNKELPWIENQKDVRARFLNSAIAKKTPQEIYAMMQNKIDSWTLLSQVKADLREWLPLTIAVIAWMLIGEENE